MRTRQAMAVTIPRPSRQLSCTFWRLGRRMFQSKSKGKAASTTSERIEKTVEMSGQ